MGTIKDIVDLTTQLSNSVTDRKLASDLNKIQSLLLALQSEQAGLHETNIELREERLTLKESIQKLESEIKEIKSTPTSRRPNGPICPNCSTETKPFYMRTLGKDFVEVFGATHECPKCKYTEKVED